MKKRMIVVGAQMAAIFSLIAHPVLADSPSKSSQNDEPVSFSFGVVADVQYAEKETKNNYRFFSESPARLNQCVKDLNQHDLAFTIQLGDLINGNGEKTSEEMVRILGIYNTLSMPKYHVIGNHDLSDVYKDKSTLVNTLGISNAYYDFTSPKAKGWRFIVIDGNDPREGEVGPRQLEWLTSKLSEASGKKEKVIVFCHYALLKKAAGWGMFKAEKVLQAINSSDCVEAYIAGHFHGGGYTFANGVHHITVKGMVEAHDNAYAVIDVYPGKLKEIGFSDEPSRELTFGVEMRREPPLPLPDKLDIPADYVPSKDLLPKKDAQFQGKFLCFKNCRGVEIGKYNGVYPIYIVSNPIPGINGDLLQKGDVIVGVNGEGLGETPVEQWRRVNEEVMGESTRMLKVTRWRKGKLENVNIDLSQFSKDGG